MSPKTMRMPPIERESRQDDDQAIRMPDVIHLAPTIQVDSPIDPVIIEDLTGYEVSGFEYHLSDGIDYH